MKISLRDPLWQFIAVILSLTAIAITVIVYYQHRQYKELSFETISSSPLLAKSKEIEGNVQIFFDNKSVNNVYLIILKLINSGNTPISDRDYESPLTFNFGEHTNILLADVTKTEIEVLKIKLDIMKTKVIVEPILLNANDAIIFKFLLSDFSEDLKTEARIYGIKDILSKKKENYILTSILLGAISGLLVSCIILVIMLLSIRKMRSAFRNLLSGLK